MRIALLSTSDTDLLSARSSGADYWWSNPSRATDAELTHLVEDADLVVVRQLGSAHDLWPGLAAVRESGTPVVVLGGELQPSSELMEFSTVSMGIATEAHRYLAEGGPANLGQLHAFLSDTVLLTGGVRAALRHPCRGVRRLAGTHETNSSADRCPLLPRPRDQREQRVRARTGRRGRRDRTGRRCADLRRLATRRAHDLYDALGTLDALIVTLLAAGGSVPATASAGGDDEAWDVERMAAIDIPVLQGLCLTNSQAEWEASDDGVSPLDYASQIAIPEFDGRIATAPFSSKEIDEQGLPVYVADPERADRVARIAVNHALLRRTTNSEKRLALVLSTYPTKHARIGNPVGLDTPVSATRLLRDEGYDTGDLEFLDMEDDTEAGDALIHALIAAGGQDEEWLTLAQLTEAHVRITTSEYDEWSADLPADLRDSMTEAWGEAPGSLFVNEASEIVIATLQAGNVVILIQPPRGFGENPVAIYHDPDLPVTHHYLAAYRWLEHGFKAARSCTWASTGRWSGCPARTPRSRPPAARAPRWATCP